MSTETKKRGRPKKVVEEMPMSSAEKTPKPATSTRASKTSSASKAASSTTTKVSAAKSNGAGRTVNGKKEVSQEISSPNNKSTKATLKGSSSQVLAPDVTPPPPTVIHAIAIEESKILKEIAQTESKKNLLKKPLAATAPANVTPPIQEPPSTASFLQPTNTLAMGFPIPTIQSTTHNQGLHSHCLPWLPNPSPLRQAAYLSTTTPMHTAKRKLPSMKDVNKFLVTEQSSRGGRGSGAAQSRAQQAIEESRASGDGRFTQPGEMPAKYKPALRRVQAIIVALPIVVVTSYLLYERLVLGVEQKKAPRLPSGSAAETASSTDSSGGAGSS